MANSKRKGVPPASEPESEPNFSLKEQVILADGMSGVIVGARKVPGGEVMYEVATVCNGERKTSCFHGFELKR
jgi:hypothetical protein